MTVSVLKQDPNTQNVQKNAIYSDKIHNMRIFGVIRFIDYKTTLRRQLNGEEWDVELGNLSAFGWTMLFNK